MKKGSKLLFLGALTLLSIGLLMVISVSDAQAIRFGTPANYFAIRQMQFTAVALLLGCIVLPFVDYHIFLRKDIFWALVLLSFCALLSVWCPGIADDAVKGSHRWIRFGRFRIQPSEFVRVAVCILYARWCSLIQSRNEDFWRGVVIPLACLCPILGLLILQPDYGSTCLAGAVVLGVLFAGGAKLKHLLLVSLLGVAVIGTMLFADPEHRSRILSVYASEQVDDEDTHQVTASLQAFRRGGFKGVGYGNSLMKEGYLPEAHTDFILAVTGEELGLRFTLLVVLCNLCILTGGYLVSRQCVDRFGKILSFGLTLHLCLAGAVNIAVVTKMAPTKGLALPFMSYGGSNLVASFVVLGLLLSVERHSLKTLQNKPIELQR